MPLPIDSTLSGCFAVKLLVFKTIFQVLIPIPAKFVQLRLVGYFLIRIMMDILRPMHIMREFAKFAIAFHLNCAKCFCCVEVDSIDCHSELEDFK